MYKRLRRATLINFCHSLCDSVPDPSAPCMSGHPGNMHRAFWTTADSSKHADSCTVCGVLCLRADFQCKLHKQPQSKKNLLCMINKGLSHAGLLCCNNDCMWHPFTVCDCIGCPGERVKAQWYAITHSLRNADTADQTLIENQASTKHDNCTPYSIHQEQCKALLSPSADSLQAHHARAALLISILSMHGDKILAQFLDAGETISCQPGHSHSPLSPGRSVHPYCPCLGPGLWGIAKPVPMGSSGSANEGS